ncbi:hypothetical protein AB870_24705 (plasmid) [Pandoraea faecigallinarum]|uniref:Uncharacterized protein n=1 Tax=Pandoraea faecigallinarum TaxID=656179 RepID=A0A0H3X0I7_9BURK|nr:hypothetical protein AB870_24705 [Pandoraea faecigallinarum]
MVEVIFNLIPFTSVRYTCRVICDAQVFVSHVGCQHVVMRRSQFVKFFSEIHENKKRFILLWRYIVGGRKIVEFDGFYFGIFIPAFGSFILRK